jgi:hypothetical protein
VGFALDVGAVLAKQFRPQISAQIGELLEVQFLSMGLEAGKAPTIAKCL